MAIFEVGQRVAILVGVQAADGPSIGSYGTVTGIFDGWNGTSDYVVAPEDGTEALVYPAYLLQNAQDDAARDYVASIRAQREAEAEALAAYDATGRVARQAAEREARAACMAAHPAGKGRKMPDAR